MLSGDRPSRLRHSIVVTRRDGSTAALAVAEIAPDFEGNEVLLASRWDGQPIDGHSLRLVVPGDHHGGCSVGDVVRVVLH